MNNRSNQNTGYPFDPPRERGTWRSLGLAVVMHCLLLLFLLHGIQWQNSAPVGAQAELWTAEELNQPVTPPTPQPPAPVVPKVVTPPPPDDADIALQEAKKRQQQAQEQALLAEQERQKQLQLQQEADARLQQERAAQAKLAQQKADAQKLAQQKADDLKQQQLKDQQLQDQQAKQQQQQAQAAQQKAEEQKEQKAKQAAELKAKAQADKARAANLARLQGSATGETTGANGLGSTGTGTGSGGTGAGYADKVRRLVLPNIVLTSSIDGSPTAVVALHCAPDGDVLEAHISQSSGNAIWDDAVLRAVQKSGRMPRDTNGSTPANFTITFRPKS